MKSVKNMMIWKFKYNGVPIHHRSIRRLLYVENIQHTVRNEVFDDLGDEWMIGTTDE